MMVRFPNAVPGAITYGGKSDGGYVPSALQRWGGTSPTVVIHGKQQPQRRGQQVYSGGYRRRSGMGDANPYPQGSAAWVAWNQLNDPSANPSDIQLSPNPAATLQGAGGTVPASILATLQASATTPATGVATAGGLLPPYSVLTLNTYLAQWAQGVIQEPASLQGQDIASAAAQVAQDYCTLQGPADCSNMSSIVNGIVQQARAAVPSAAIAAQSSSGNGGGSAGSAGASTGTAIRVPAGNAGSAGSAPASVYIQNLTNPGATSYNVGDQWQITLSGPPGAPVSATSTQNGQSVGAATSFGNLNSGGTMVLTGTMGSSQVGVWSETWMVGNQNAGSLTFTVNSASSPAATGTGTGTSPIAASTAATGIDSSGNLSISGTNLGPWWVWAGGGALLLFMMGRK